MTDHTTDEPGWHVLREHIREATPARTLWSPRHEPMRGRDYVGATLIAIAGILAGWFWLAATP